jgi:hypothetical protein
VSRLKAAIDHLDGAAECLRAYLMSLDAYKPEGRGPGVIVDELDQIERIADALATFLPPEVTPEAG